jgi:hypothetical protein
MRLVVHPGTLSRLRLEACCRPCLRFTIDLVCFSFVAEVVLYDLSNQTYDKGLPAGA